MKDLKVITYTDKIAVVSSEEIKDGDLFYSEFKGEKRILKFDAQVIPFPNDKKLIAHYPKIEGVAGIVIEDDKVQDFIQPLLNAKSKTDNGIDLNAYALGLIDSYKQAKSNTFTEDFCIWLMKNCYKGKDELYQRFGTPQNKYTMKELFDYYKSLRKKEYEVVYNDKLVLGDKKNDTMNKLNFGQPKLTENGEFIIREI